MKLPAHPGRRGEKRPFELRKIVYVNTGVCDFNKFHIQNDWGGAQFFHKVQTQRCIIFSVRSNCIIAYLNN